MTTYQIVHIPDDGPIPMHTWEIPIELNGLFLKTGYECWEGDVLDPGEDRTGNWGDMIKLHYVHV